MALACAPADRRTPRTAAYWLWMLVVATAGAILAFIVTNAFLPADRALSKDAFGQDFLAFYSAGKLVDAGRAIELYDLASLTAIQQTIAREAGLTLAASFAPWWNPPFAAAAFAPLSRLSFHNAFATWTLLGVGCLAAAAWLLAGVIRSTSERKRDWMLVPALLIVAPPTLQSLGHGQNTAISLLLLTVTVLAWRARRPLLTGLACAMLCYKPQLALLVGVAAFATLGWRVVVGAMLALVPLMLLTLNAMPGTLTEFAIRLPANLHAVQFEQPYLWHRHATFVGFFRFAFQGNGAGETHGWISLLSFSCLAATLAVLSAAWWKLRTFVRGEDGDLALDRFIALVILATPLTMPFFFDYDLLLLAVPLVLTAREMMLVRDASRSAAMIKVLAPLTFVWLACNPPVAEVWGVNLTVPLLVTLTVSQAKRTIAPAAGGIDALTSPLPHPGSQEAMERLAA